ncbi:MAG: outer membrane lipoprotein-sorting protein [Pseudomonadota bacterium]
MFRSTEASTRFFVGVTAHPVAVLAAATVLVIASGLGLTRLVKDTSVKAFIPPGHESLVADSKTTEIFGLSDTIAVALVSNENGSVFRPDVLTALADLSEQMAVLPNIRYDRVTSLATESSISGDDGAINIDPYVDPLAPEDTLIAGSEQRWRWMTPHQGTLVSDDGTAAAILAELEDAATADETYRSVMAMVDEVALDGITIHVAGSGAVSGYLSSYIDQDARKLQPLVFVVVLGFIFLAFRRGSALPGPLLVVAGSAAGSLGVMGWCGIPYYAITNALPVILVAISVADAIHILSAFYRLKAMDEQAETRDLVVRAMASVARPVTLTTITTIAGFLGIAAMSIMPPITWFGVFAALGVALAWVFSILVLPSVLVLTKPRPSPAFSTWKEGKPSALGRVLGAAGWFTHRRYRTTLLTFTALTVVAVFGALQLRVDRSQVENFAAGEPIRIADELINERFAGTAFLDVLVETSQPDGLLDIEVMTQVRELQQYFETLPHVQKTVSIVDYLSHLHGAVQELPKASLDARVLPDTSEALAETLFLYAISGDPTDLEEEIDGDNQRALIRGVLNAHYFSETRLAVEAMQRYINEEFNRPGLTASLSGDVNVSYHWMRSLQTSHFKSVLLSLTLVLAASIVVFRSAVAGVLSVVPVVFTVIVLYACMGFLNVHLEPATSMFAAIAVGVGVDFAIHLVDRLRATGDVEGAVSDLTEERLPAVARACFFNSAALGLGFSVLLVSDLPTLIRFGGLVAVASLASYLAALLVIPALLSAEQAVRGQKPKVGRRADVVVSLTLLGVVIAGLFSTQASAAPKDANEIAAAVSEREEATSMRRVLKMTLTNKRGKVELREAIVHKQKAEDARQTRITFLEPKRSRDITFLSHDRAASTAADQRWMYLPASRKVRRIPASQRGKSFLGTDFSYEDIQSELKFALDDWDFSYERAESVGASTRHHIAGTPKSKKIARELGYGGFTAVVDEATWMPRRIEFSDFKGRALKTITVGRVVQVDGIWTAEEILAVNHQTGHQTAFTFYDTNYSQPLASQLFEPQTLGRGLGREFAQSLGE